MANAVFINHQSSWQPTDISHYAYRNHIVELLESKWPSRVEGRTTIQNYQIQPTENANGDFRIWAPQVLTKEDKQQLYDRYAALQRPRTNSWRTAPLQQQSA